MIYNIDRNKALRLAQGEALFIWRKMGKIHPRVLRKPVPIISINGRLYKTAGRCFQDLRKIDLGWKFIAYSPDYCDIMYKVILPHELMHQIDYDLFGESEKPCGHGANWKMLMLQYGLKPNPYHEMYIKR